MYSDERWGVGWSIQREVRDNHKDTHTHTHTHTHTPTTGVSCKMLQASARQTSKPLDVTFRLGILGNPGILRLLQQLIRFRCCVRARSSLDSSAARKPDGSISTEDAVPSDGLAQLKGLLPQFVGN